jgi:hypothetical protein
LGRDDDSENMPELLDANNERVCSFGNAARYYPTEGDPPSDANGEVIAAAPEMLELLRLIDDSSGYEDLPQGWMDKRNALLKRIDGGSSTDS